MVAQIDNNGIVQMVGNFTDTGIPCDRSVGIGWVYTNGVFSKPLSLFKSEKKEALNQWHDEQTTAMRAKYSQSEFESFLDKRNEAMAWRSNNTSLTPYIDAMSGGNVEVRTMLINSILAKVDATAQLEMQVLMTRDAIELCTTQTQLDAIVW